MNVTSTTNATGTSTATATATTGSTQTLGENDFLKLLTAQMQAQDPLNPMDSANFAAQLAQFSSVEQLTNINTQLTSLNAAQTSIQNTMATDLIGKNVTVTGNKSTLANGQAVMPYTLSADAAKVTVAIYDGTGALVKTSVLSAQTAGSNSYTWDGKDQNGNSLPAGQYTFSVAAADAQNQPVTVTPLTSGIVTGISFNNNVTSLTLDNGTQVQLGDIHQIAGGA
jgi:flagellar basal-body rod modification protein FlgD